MALKIVQEEQTYNEWESQVLPILKSTSAEAADASYELATMDTLTEGFQERQIQARLQEMGGKTLTPQQLNERYGGEGIFFKEPTNEHVAEEVAVRRRQKSKLAEIAGYGPDGLINSTKYFGSSMLGGASDIPTLGLYAASSFILGAAAPAVAALEGVTGILAKEAATAAIAGLVETPLQQYQRSRDQEDVTATSVIANYAENIAINAGFGVLPHGAAHAVGFGGRKIAKGWDWVTRSTDTAGKDAFEAVIAQSLSNKRPDVSHIGELLDRERSGVNPTDIVDYSGRVGESKANITLDGQASGRFFYGTNSASQELASIDHAGIKPFKNNYGDGVYLTDNAVKANNYASSKFNANQGNIFEVNLSDAKLLNTKEHIPGDVLSRMKSALIDSVEGKAGKKAIADAIDDGASLEQIFNEIHASAPKDVADRVISQINEEAKRAGYDGYVVDSEGTSRDIMLFGKEKLEQRGVYEPDRRLNPDTEEVSRAIDDKYKGRMNSPESDFGYSATQETVLKDMDAKIQQMSPDKIDTELAEAYQQAIADLKSAIDEQSLNAEDAKLAQEVIGKATETETGTKTSDIVKQEKINEASIKAAIDCVGK